MYIIDSSETGGGGGGGDRVHRMRAAPLCSRSTQHSAAKSIATPNPLSERPKKRSFVAGRCMNEWASTGVNVFVCVRYTYVYLRYVYANTKHRAHTPCTDYSDDDDELCERMRPPVNIVQGHHCFCVFFSFVFFVGPSSWAAWGSSRWLQCGSIFAQCVLVSAVMF